MLGNETAKFWFFRVRHLSRSRDCAWTSHHQLEHHLKPLIHLIITHNLFRCLKRNTIYNPETKMQKKQGRKGRKVSCASHTLVTCPVLKQHGPTRNTMAIAFSPLKWSCWWRNWSWSRWIHWVHILHVCTQGLRPQLPPTPTLFRTNPINLSLSRDLT